MNRVLRASVVLLVAGALSASAQFVPLHVGSAAPIHDEFGQLLRGSAPAAAQFGFPVVVGDVVQVLTAPEGVFPPSTNGAPDSRNGVVFTTRIGMGVDAALGELGEFSGSITDIKRDSPSDTNTLFARVFNAADLEQSSFYADSQLYQVPVWGASSYGLFKAVLGSTTQMMDGTDYDGDGLTRSWELSYGANPDNPDTDGDGMADGAEIRAGTGVTNSESLLIMVQIIPQPPYDLDLQWDTVSGRVYQIEYTTNSLDQEPVFVSVNEPYPATDVLGYMTVTNGLLDPNAHYRVRLVEP